MGEKTLVSTQRAPAAIGPYSQAVKCAGFVFCSGQVALDPETGAMSQGDVVEQTKKVMANLLAVLSAAGAAPKDVVRTTIFLANMGDFQKVNEVYAETFGDDPPARACVEVSRLPKDALVEIDAIAHVKA